MISTLLTLAALADASCRGYVWEVQQLSESVERESVVRRLPTGLLLAVVLAETGGRNVVSQPRRCGGWDVGYAQVHTHKHTEIGRLRNLEQNIRTAAGLLVASRDKCSINQRWRVCRRSPWGLYNAGSSTWSTAVHSIWRRLMMRVLINQDVVDRFWSKVDVLHGPVRPGESLCWLWQGAIDWDGYGMFEACTVKWSGKKSRTYRAHRFAFIILTGKILDANQHVCHSCDVPRCCNPAHLWVGTNLDNIRDRCKKGRSAQGDKSGARQHPEKVRRGHAVNTSKLQATDVLAIRAAFAAGASKRSLSRRFAVARHTILKIVEGVYWKHLLSPPDEAPAASECLTPQA